MDTELALQKAESLLKEVRVSSSRPEAIRLDVVIDRKDLKTAVKAMLIDEHWGYLSAITGLDHPEYKADETTQVKTPLSDAGTLELLYHFCSGAAVTTLRVSLPYSDPTVDSICDLISSVSLYEREAMELFGITFTGTPNTDHLILPDDWPAGVYPLRKSFTGLEKKTQA